MKFIISVLCLNSKPFLLNKKNLVKVVKVSSFRSFPISSFKTFCLPHKQNINFICIHSLMSLCVCVCMRVRERECVCVCLRERKKDNKNERNRKKILKYMHIAQHCINNLLFELFVFLLSPAELELLVNKVQQWKEKIGTFLYCLHHYSFEN